MSLTAGRLALLVAFALLLIGSLAALGFVHADAEGFALAGLALWALSGALD